MKVHWNQECKNAARLKLQGGEKGECWGLVGSCDYTYYYAKTKPSQPHNPYAIPLNGVSSCPECAISSGKTKTYVILLAECRIFTYFCEKNCPGNFITLELERYFFYFALVSCEPLTSLGKKMVFRFNLDHGKKGHYILAGSGLSL